MNKITINAPFNPFDTVDLSPIRIGGYTVTRQRLAGTTRTRYRVMLQDQVAGQQLSYPSESDCAKHVRQFDETAQRARSRVHGVIQSATGTMSARILRLLAGRTMADTDLAGSLRCTGAAMSPVLNKLVRDMHISRTGEPGSYTYSAR